MVSDLWLTAGEHCWIWLNINTVPPWRNPIPQAPKDNPMNPVLLALGANIGDRVANLSSALRLLGECVDIKSVSSVYETAPMYVTDQNRFLNMVVSGTTGLTGPELLIKAKQFEARIGRSKTKRNGPRQIDIDVVFLGDQVIDDPGGTDRGWLSIPHPRMAERPFVLIPAAEIVPDWRHPVLGRTVADLAAALDLPEDQREIVRRGPLGPDLDAGQTA